MDCDAGPAVVLCGGDASCNADAETNLLGETTVATTTLAASRCGIGTGQTQDAMAVVVQGALLLDAACVSTLCLPIQVRSVDLTGDGVLTPADLSTLAGGVPPLPFATCMDFNGDGANSLADIATFAAHFGPPGP